MKRKTELNLTIGTAFDMYVQNQEIKGISRATIRNEETALSTFLESTGLTLNDFLSVVNRNYVNNFIVSLDALSLSTKNIHLAHLRTFLYWAMEENYLEPFKIKLVKGQESKIKFYTDEEIKKLITKPGKSFYEHRIYTLVCFILSTGARASTVLNLKKEDLDFKSKTITFTHLKNKSTAIIPMSNSLFKILMEYLNTWDIQEYVFCNGDGEQLTMTALENALRRYCLKKGVKPRGPHSLRHSFSRMFIKSGGNAFELQQLLTHSSMEMTRRYVQLFAEDMRSSINMFDPLKRVRS